MIKLQEISATELDKYVAKHHPEANFLQTSNWGKVHALDHKKVFHLGLYDDDNLVGSALVVLRPAKRGRYLEIPGGPLLDWHNTKQARTFMEEIRKIAQRENCVFVRMRPNIPDTEENRAIAKNLGLLESPMHLHAEHTVMLDITKSEDELMAAMRRQTRYEVRRSAKLGITVESSTDKKAFEEFFELQSETAKRQNFIPPSKDFLIYQHEVFGDLAKIYTAKIDGKVLAQGLVLLQKPEAIYHEAASSEEGRKYPGAYALQWQVIQDAKKLGLKRYNLFGIAPPNSPHHRYAGVTTFKCGFGGEQIAYLHARDLVIKPIHYKAVQLLEKARKKHRHL